MDTWYWLDYPSEFNRRLKPLLHQQMWLFGRDILCPEGNLLYRYGFTHRRGETKGSSMYLQNEADRHIVLWGWGIWFGHTDSGAIFVNRYQARPRFTALHALTRPIHKSSELPDLTYRVGTRREAESVRQLWHDLLQWLAKYEAWIVAECGTAWRETALKSFPHAVTKRHEVDRIALQWRELAERATQLSIKCIEEKRR